MASKSIMSLRSRDSAFPKAREGNETASKCEKQGAGGERLRQNFSPFFAQPWRARLLARLLDLSAWKMKGNVCLEG